MEYHSQISYLPMSVNCSSKDLSLGSTKPKFVVNSDEMVQSLTMPGHTMPSMSNYAKESSKAVGIVGAVNEELRNKSQFCITPYKALHRPGYVFHVRHPSKFQLLGFLDVRILSGGVEIYGYNLCSKSNSSSIFIYGSEQLQSYQINTNIRFANDIDELQNRCCHLLLPEDLTSILSAFSKNDAILYVEEINVLGGIFAQPYVRTYSKPCTEKSRSRHSIKCRNMECVVTDVCHEKYGTYSVGNEWNEIKLGPRTIAVGQCGSGKSAILKFFVNKLLTEYDEIVYLDLDLGQGEFSPPGSIGAYIVKRPLFGPNFTHNIKSEIEFHVGDVDVSHKSKEYIHCVKSLVNFVDSSSALRRLPRVINAMGFFRGLGEMIIRGVIAITQPTTLVQMYREDKEIKNIIDFQNLRPKAGNFLLSEEGLDNHYNFYLVKSSNIVLALKDTKSGMPKKKARDLMLLSNLNHLLEPPYFTFNTASHYKVPLDSLVFGLNNKISPNDVFRALNGSLVSLSELPESLKILDAKGLNIIFNPPIVSCIGLGIVRGIDMNEKELYLLTNLPSAQLDNVKLLTLSCVQLPQEIFLKQGDIDCFVPYTSVNDDVLSHVKLNRIFPMQPNATPRKENNLSL